MICCCCPKYLDHYYMNYVWKHIRDENAPIKCHHFYYLEHLFRITLSFWKKHLFLTQATMWKMYWLVWREMCGGSQEGLSANTSLTSDKEGSPGICCLEMGPMSQSWKVADSEDYVIHLQLHFLFL